MGAYLSEPMTAKQSEDGEGNRLKFGACSMQGWRVSQEDAHNCIAAFDEDSSLFAVYDGHGGAEVAIFLSRRLPDVLKCCTAYTNGEFVKGLKECYLKIDESIKTPEVLKEIQQIAKCNAADNEAVVDYEEENVGALYEEATMPLDKLVAKYQTEANEVDEEEPNCKPGSSKSITGCSSSSPGSSRSSRSSTSGVAGRSSDTPAGGSSSSSTKCVEADAPGGSSSSDTGAGSSSSAKSSSEDTGKVDSASPAKCSPDSALESSTSKVNGEGPSEEPKSLSEENEKEVKTELKENSDNDKESATTHSLGELIVEGKRIELKHEDKLGDTNGSSKNEPSELNPSPGVNGNSSSSPKKIKEVELAKVEGEKMESESTKKESTGTIANGDPSSIAEKDECKATTENSPPAETPRRKKVHPTPVIIENSTPERRSPRKSQNSNLRSFDCSDSDESDEDDDDAGYDMEDSDSDEEMLEEEDDEDEESSDDYDDEDAEEDEKFLNDIQEPGYDSGSTAVVCFMKWEADSLSLWVANAGDSRCVVCREGKAIDMSHDHKPELDEEAQRIVKAGGKVTDDGRVNGGLNLSRAIGDHSYKQNATLPPEEQMISPMPCVEHIVLHPSKDKFIVLACDGIWNSMGSQEVVDFVGGRLDKNEPLSKICEELFDTCLASDTGGDGTGCDNMTAIIVEISDSPQAFSGSKRRHGSGEAKPDPETLKKSRAD